MSLLAWGYLARQILDTRLHTSFECQILAYGRRLKRSSASMAAVILHERGGSLEGQEIVDVFHHRPSGRVRGRTCTSPRQCQCALRSAGRAWLLTVYTSKSGIKA